MRAWCVVQTFVSGPSLIDVQLRSHCVTSAVQQTGVENELTELSVQSQLVGVVLVE